MSSTTAPTGRYRIAEVAELTGFTPTTLRYYEAAGILAPPPRSAAGYRVFDDRDVERLQLVARAKALGLRLDEIGELVEAWDGDECAPVKHHLRSLVDRKLAETDRRIEDHRAFAAQLRATAAALADRPVDGACDETCGCTSNMTAPGPSPSAAEEQVAIACSLDSTGRTARLDAWRALGEHVEDRRPIDGGLRLVFAPSAPLPEIAHLVAQEHGCCPFFGFAITVDDRGLALEVTAPPGGLEVLASVFGRAR